MLAKVIKNDESVIYNGKIYCHGDEFEINEAIGKSLIERGYIAGIEDDVKEDDIENMSYPELKSYAKELGLSASGTKEDLIFRIKQHLADLENAETEDDAEGDDAETEDDAEDELPDTSMPE